jgi:hypothetical protein
MYFGFDDDQVAFKQAVRELLDRECPPQVVRAAWEALPGKLDRNVWDRLSEMGVLTAVVPERQEGLGLDERSLVVMLEESGRAGLPHSLVETAAVAAPLVAAMAERTGTESTPDCAGSMVASNLGGPNVACAADADLLLLHDAGRGELHLIPADDRVGLEPIETVDRARRAARIEWSPRPETLLTDDRDEAELAFARGALGTAAQLLGLGQRMLDMTVSYVGEREQFGQPVGSFQAVKHHLADALKELAFARPVVYRAAHSVATGAATRERDVSMAKAMASDAACFVGRQALQCHGAIGYTVEADLHLYLKRTWALAAAWGTAAWHRERVAAHILGPSQRSSDGENGDNP